MTIAIVIGIIVFVAIYVGGLLMMRSKNASTLNRVKTLKATRYTGPFYNVHGREVDTF